MKTPRSSPWTAFRVLLVLFVLLDIVAFIVWATLNPDRYQAAKGVIISVWGGMGALFALLKLKSPPETPFVELIGSRPMPAAILLVTGLTLGAGLSYAPLRPYELVLAAGPAALEVEIVKPNGRIETSRLSAGEPPLRLRGSPGDYMVRGSEAGFVPLKEHFPVGLFNFATVRREIRLLRETGWLALRPAGTPDLTVRAQPAGDSARTIPAQRLSETTVWELPADAYVVVASAPRHYESRIPTEVRPRDTTTIDVELVQERDRPPGVVEVTAHPEGADIIQVGNGTIARSPDTLRLPEGTYHFVLRHRGGSDYGNQRAYTVDVVSGERTEVGGLLDPVSLARVAIGRAPDGRGTYFALDEVTGEEILVGPAGREAAALLFPGRVQLIRKADGEVFRGPRLELASGERRDERGF